MGKRSNKGNTHKKTSKKQSGLHGITKHKLKNKLNKNPKEVKDTNGQNKVKKTNRSRFRSLPLRERMMEKLKGAKFRFLNEQLYKSDGKDRQEIFKNNTNSFTEYHDGFRQQVASWPINPVDVIIKSLLKKVRNEKLTIADFGCGEAKIAESLEGQAEVHSFDLVALNEKVTECDMSHTSLKSSTVDIAVFCLSLMGANLSGYLKEANRVLKDGGLLKIAEVESRFTNVNEFINTLERYGFKMTTSDLSHKIFYFMNFKKTTNISKKRKNRLPEINLKPCLYKKR